jgi:hypothetical protein
MQYIKEFEFQKAKGFLKILNRSTSLLSYFRISTSKTVSFDLMASTFLNISSDIIGTKIYLKFIIKPKKIFSLYLSLALPIPLRKKFI